MTGGERGSAPADVLAPQGDAAQAAVIREVIAERARQDELWGIQDHDPYLWLAILTEEVGEVARALLDATEEHRDVVGYREELIQVAAVAVAMVEAWDRRLPSQ